MSDWKDITKPSPGDPPRESLFGDIIDDLNWLKLFQSGGGGGSSSYYSIANGGMELDGDDDGIPDSWEFTPSVGGSGELDTTESIDGLNSFKMVSPGGGGNGGGELITKEYIPIQASVRYFLKFWMKASDANMRNVVEMLRYDDEKNYIDTVTLLDYSTGNPTSWTLFARWTDNPVNARFCKIKLTGGYPGHATGGTVYFDAVDFFIPQLISTVVKTSTDLTYAHTQAGVFADVEVYGGGGGGGATGSSSGVDGGCGEDGNKGRGIVALYGLTTSITIGAGGIGGNPGTTGGTTTVTGGSYDTVSATGGTGGVAGSNGAGSYVGISGSGGTGYLKGTRGSTHSHAGGAGGSGGAVLHIYGARG